MGITPGGQIVTFVTVIAALLILIVAILGAAVLMVRAALSNGDTVEKPDRIRQLYGYTICLVAVVTGLISVASVLGHAFDLMNPLAAEASYETSYTSFEAWKETRNRFNAQPDRSLPDTASETTLRARYEVLRADHLTQRLFQARKGLVVQGLLLFVALGLFVVHWRWMKKLGGEGA